MSVLFDEGPLQTSRLTLHCVQTARPQSALRKVLFLGGSNFDLTLKRDFEASPLVHHGDFATYEPRGIGHSDRPDGAWSMADYAADALSVLDALNWATALVVGESFGGMTALHLAQLAPERVEALVISSTTPGGAGGASYDIAEFLHMSRKEAARRSLAILDTRNVSFAQTDPKAFATKLAARVEFEKAFAASSMVHGGYQRLLAARAGHDIWSALPDIAVPTLVLSGRHDAQAPLDAQTRLAESLPRATHWVRSEGHGVMFSDPTVLREALNQWLPSVAPEQKAAG
ncbi:MAG: alpha/beta hydrolase [Pseudomonadota bacterium]